MLAQQWKALEMHGGGKVTGIIFHPSDPNIIYNRTDVAGLNVSQDGGDTWKSLTFNVPKDNPHNFTTRNLAIDPSTPNTMYYCAGNAPRVGSSSIFKSTDGGNQWTRISNPTNFSGNGAIRWGDETFIIDPITTSNLFVGGQASFNAGTWQDGGFYSSTDSGNSWTPIHSAIFEQSWISAVKFHPADPNLIYISAITNTESGISTPVKGLWEYNRSNGSITQMHTENVDYFEFDAVTNKIIVSRLEGIQVYDPINGTWSAIVRPLNADYNYYIEAHPLTSGRWYFGGFSGFNNSGLVETLDGGQTFHQSKYTGGSNIQKLNFPDFSETNVKVGHGNSMAGVYFNPHDPSIAFMDGIWKTTDAASPLVNTGNPNELKNNGNWNWTWVADGIHIMVTLRVSPHVSEAERFAVNVADVGLYTTVDGGQDMLFPGLLLHYSAATRYAKSDPNVGYIVGQKFDNTGQIRKTINGGQSWFSPMATNFFEDAIVIQDLQIMDDNPDHLVVGVHQDGLPNQIYRSSDGGTTWNTWDQGITENNIFKEWESIDRLQKDENDVFYTYKNDKMYRRGWDDAAWTLIGHPNGTTNINHLVLQPSNPGVFFMTISNNKIYKWDNGTWSEVASPTNISDLLAVSPNGSLVVMEKLWVSGERTQKLFMKPVNGTWAPLTFDGFGGVMKNMLFLDDTRLVGISNGQGANILHLDENNNCLDPSNFYAASIDQNGATIHWQHPSTPTFSLEYSLANQNNWIVITNANTGLTLNNLLSCTDYDIRLKSDCGGGQESNYIYTSFKTKAENAYCQSYSQSTWRYWIENVDINNDTYFSQWNGGYVDWGCDQASSIIAGDNITLNLEPGFLDLIKNMVWYVWIDFDRDGIWTIDERVVSSAPSDQVQSFSIPTDANLAPGPLKMRVLMHRYFENIDLNACDPYSAGETEDFVLDVVNTNTCLLVQNTNDDGLGSLRAAIECAMTGETITFHPDLQNSTIGITSLVMVINKDLKIIANPSQNISVSGVDVGRVFIVNVFKNVEMKGFNIISGSTLDGRAIYNRGNLILDNMTIHEKAGHNGDGSKILNEDELIIRNATSVKF